MILSDLGIKYRIGKGSIVIDPIDDWDVQIQPASVDLRLSNIILAFKRGSDAIDPMKKETIDSITEKQEIENYTVLQPGEFILGSTIEKVTLPPDIAGKVEGRSSIGRLGISVHTTAGFIDPGFSGNITLEISNSGMYPVIITPGIRICQIVFYAMSSPADRPYGAGRGSKYIDQDGPVGSRITEDFQMPPGRITKVAHDLPPVHCYASDPISMIKEGNRDSRLRDEEFVLDCLAGYLSIPQRYLRKGVIYDIVSLSQSVDTILENIKRSELPRPVELIISQLQLIGSRVKEGN